MTTENLLPNPGITAIFSDSDLGLQLATHGDHRVLYVDATARLDGPLPNVLATYTPETLQQALDIVLRALQEGLKDTLIVLDSVDTLPAGIEGMAAKALLWMAYMAPEKPSIKTLLAKQNCQLLIIHPSEPIPKILKYVANHPPVGNPV